VRRMLTLLNGPASRGTTVRLLRSTYAQPHRVRLLAALDGVARRPSIGTTDILWPRRAHELPSQFAQGR